MGRFGAKQVRRAALTSLLFLGLTSAAQAEETDNLSLTIDVTNNEVPCDSPTPVTFSATWFMSATSSNTAIAVVDDSIGTSVSTDIYVNWLDGSDGCGEIIPADGVVQTSVFSNSPEITDITVDCSAACPIGSVAEGLIGFSANVPAGTPTGTYSVSIDVTWVPAG